jgi:RNA recognition motif-containing protein
MAVAYWLLGGLCAWCQPHSGSHGTAITQGPDARACPPVYVCPALCPVCLSAAAAAAHHTSVHIITDYGRPTGVALVEFATPQDAQAAAAKDKQMMGTRYIEVFPSSREELQRYLPRSY